MWFRSFICCAALAVSASSEANPLLERQLVKLGVADTTPSRGVSDAYAKRGYVSDHNATCVIGMYNTSEGHAAGDRDLERISSNFMKLLNHVFENEAKGSTTTAGTPPPPPVLVTMTEVEEQTVGTELVETVRRSLRSLAVKFRWSFNYANLKVNYVCPPNFCWGLDNAADHGNGRQLLSPRELQELPQALLESLVKSNSTYLQPISCIVISCDSGATWEESDGCAGIPEIAIP